MTVAELIEILKTAPPTAELIIQDADTSWPLYLHKEGVGVEKDAYGDDEPGFVFLNAGYTDQRPYNFRS